MRLNMSARTQMHLNGVQFFIEHDAFSGLDRGCIGDFRVRRRVSCEVVAYQGYAAWAWSVLPISALCELAGLTVYAINILGTFILERSHAQKEPVILGIPVELSQKV
jgi:hypothetical protein